MKNIFTIIFVIFMLIGCASQIMKTYIGKDVREVMLDYGPPANAIDMGNGKRAFQWVMDSSYTTPTTATTIGAVNTYGSSTWVSSNTTIYGGQTINSRCIYTMFANWSDDSNGWGITGFKSPDFMCE